jgi:F-type H+-transporting ATPase subunit b
VQTLTVTHLGAGGLAVRFSQSSVLAAETATTEDTVGPKPIAPEGKELAWGAGAFIVFALLMRFVLFPKLKTGMQARYGKIRSDHAAASATRSAALAEVADYQAALAAVKAEAAGRVDAARHTLESERTARLATVNAGINERRSAAIADAEAAKAAARSTVESAVGDVASRTIELAIGKRPAADAVSRVVADVMGAGAIR